MKLTIGDEDDQQTNGDEKNYINQQTIKMSRIYFSLFLPVVVVDFNQLLFEIVFLHLVGIQWVAQRHVDSTKQRKSKEDNTVGL